MPIIEQKSHTGSTVFASDWSSNLVTIPASTNPQPDLTQGDTFYFLASAGAFTLSVPTVPPGTTAGATVILFIQQDDSTSAPILFGTGFYFPGNVKPTLSTQYNAVDLFKLRYDGTWWEVTCFNNFHGARFYRPSSASFLTDANVTWTNPTNTYDTVIKPRYPGINMDTTTFGYPISSSGVDVNTNGFILGWSGTVTNAANCYLWINIAPIQIGATIPVFLTASFDNGTTYNKSLASLSSSSSTISSYSLNLTGLLSSSLSNLRLEIPAGRHTQTQQINIYDIYVAEIFP